MSEWLLIYVVVEEDLLGAVVSLVYEEEFASYLCFVVVPPEYVVVLDCHGASFLEAFQNSHKLLNRVAIYIDRAFFDVSRIEIIE